MDKKGFNSLKSEWYDKLKKDGFHDIEDNKFRIKQKYRRAFIFYTAEATREFFSHIGYYLGSKPKISPLHEYILERYCEGIYICDIAIEVGMTDRGVRNILNSYKKLILGVTRCTKVK